MLILYYFSPIIQLCLSVISKWEFVIMSNKIDPDKRYYDNLQRVLRRGLTFIPPVSLVNETGEIYSEKNTLNFTLAEPYSAISRYFLEMRYEDIIPVDSESGLFLPRISISPRTSNTDLIKIAGKAGAVIPSDGTVVTGSSEGTESLFTLFSIVCFSIFVKFFHTILKRKKDHTITLRDYDYLDLVRTYEHKYSPLPEPRKDKNEENILTKIVSAGRSIVSRRLVDSIFGNISLRDGEHLFISESGSFLDDLNDRIVKVPLSGSSGSSRKPSSEIKVHRNIYKETEETSLIHGHPMFTIILSLDCTNKCSVISEIPVVSDENGPGLEYSIPEMISKNGNVIAKGHGIFCSGSGDFNQSLDRMAEIENYCREEYFRRLL